MKTSPTTSQSIPFLADHQARGFARPLADSDLNAPGDSGPGAVGISDVTSSASHSLQNIALSAGRWLFATTVSPLHNPGMAFFSWIFHLMRGVVHILRKGSTFGRFRLFRCYLRIECKGMLFRLIGRDPREERLWTHNIHFSDYPSFLTLFEQVFLSDDYFFQSETAEPHVIDCGANVGMAIAYILSHYPQAHILAFEANPDNFAILQRNRVRNDWQRVEIFNLALQGQEAIVPFYAEGAGSMIGSVRGQSAAGRMTVREVQGVRLSGFIDKTVDFMKMDIEGSEEAVLEDLVESRKLRMVKEMVIEYHHHFTPGENRLGRFLLALESTGFGYHLKSPWNTPFSKKEQEQALMIGAYREPSTAGDA